MKILDLNLCTWKNYMIFLCKHTPIPLDKGMVIARVWTSKPLTLTPHTLFRISKGLPLPLSCLRANYHMNQSTCQLCAPSHDILISHPQNFKHIYIQVIV